ncbi:ATP-grasp domain-containing protein [Streptomyces sp. NPDC050388]|uniref:ATP-grasp domain-containing protein n=1 Tax=Streptomyces sp. NPDC050388 TaxID=3155781 RepID=UPI00343F8383
MVGMGAVGSEYLHSAARHGMETRIVENPEKLRSLGLESHPSCPVTGDTEEEWVAAALAAAADWRPDAVLPFGEDHVIAAAFVQEALGLPGPSMKAAVVSRNKGLQRAVFAAAGLPQPEYVVTDDVASAGPWAEDRFPVVVKPLSGSGSTGVVFAPGPQELARVGGAYEGKPRVLVEAACLAPEYSWEALVHHGEVIFENYTAKETTGPPQFVEVAHRSGFVFESPLLAERAHRIAHGVVQAIGMRDGIVHLEFRLDDDSAAIMEVAVRTPGDWLMEATGFAHGFNMFEALIRISGGERPDIPTGPEPVRFAGTCQFGAEPGRVVSIEGVEEVRALEEVDRVWVGAVCGDEVRELRSSFDRVAAVLVDAPTAAAREGAIAKARKTLRVTTEPVPVQDA